MTSPVWVNLAYYDAPTAIRFLVDTLGFEAAAVYKGPGQDTVAHAELRWPTGGGVTLHSSGSEVNSILGLARQAALDCNRPTR